MKPRFFRGHYVLSRATKGSDGIIELDPVFPIPTPNTGGFRGDYFGGENFQCYISSRLDSPVNFNWASGESPFSLVPYDSFSVRWWGTIVPDYSEAYTFYATADDGVRLYVNGTLLINEWRLRGPTTDSATINLVAGTPYPAIMEYFDGNGGAVAVLEWQSASQVRQAIPNTKVVAGPTVIPTPTPTPTPTNLGFYAEYFNDQDLNVVGLSRVDSLISFDWGGGSPGAGIGSDHFSVRWQGKVQPQFSHTYTFYAAADDGVRLWVNGTLLVDHWRDQGVTEYSGTINLAAGNFYPIIMEYYENGGGAAAYLSWSSPSVSKQIIPNSRVVRDIVLTPTATPTSTPTPLPGTTYIGERSILGLDDNGNGDLLLVQPAALAQPATIQSLSFYITATSGVLRLGIYDDSGTGGLPGTLVAETAEITPVLGWNTVNVITPVQLTSGNYWPAYAPSSNNLHFRRSGNGGPFYYYSRSYQALPAIFDTSILGTGKDHWSFYATLLGPTPTPTP